MDFFSRNFKCPLHPCVFHCPKSWCSRQRRCFGYNYDTYYLLSFFMISIALNKNEKLNQHIKKNQILGLILGLISGFCLLESGSLEDLFSKFNILFLGCAFIWASLTIFTHKAKKANALTINFYINALSMLLLPLFYLCLIALKFYQAMRNFGSICLLWPFYQLWWVLVFIIMGFTF